MTDPRFPHIVEHTPEPEPSFFIPAICVWLLLVVGGTLIGWGLALFITQWAHVASTGAI